MGSPGVPVEFKSTVRRQSSKRVAGARLSKQRGIRNHTPGWATNVQRVAGTSFFRALIHSQVCLRKSSAASAHRGDYCPAPSWGLCSKETLGLGLAWPPKQALPRGGDSGQPPQRTTVKLGKFYENCSVGRPQKRPPRPAALSQRGHGLGQGQRATGFAAAPRAVTVIDDVISSLLSEYSDPIREAPFPLSPIRGPTPQARRQWRP